MLLVKGNAGLQIQTCDALAARATVQLKEMMSRKRGSPFGEINRREAVVGLAALSALATNPRAAFRGAENDRGDFFDTALGAARWLRRMAIKTPTGVTWAADPADVASIQHNLYSGSAGVVLMYAELANITHDAEFADMAREGAQYLAATLRAPNAAELYAGETLGLYTGLAGVAFTLERAHKATGDASLLEASHKAVATLLHTQKANAGWNESNDIISGSAGIGLTMLWAAQALGTREAVESASRAGRALLAAGIPKPVGTSWAISSSVPRRYPNFSHGAGGAGYFLAQLYAATKEQAFLDGALAAAAYLQSVATETPNGGRMVFHSEPGNEQLYYLSWCHGPSGTARLFHTLARVTKRGEFAEYAEKLNTATRDMKVPERSPGFWNNISQCCGNCGVAEYLAAQYQRGGDSRQRDYAERIARDVIARATPDGDGLKWIQAEHRVRPDLLVAQTGLMQGAAGVALAMLHVDGARARRAPFVILPDNPYHG